MPDHHAIPAEANDLPLENALRRLSAQVSVPVTTGVSVAVRERLVSAGVASARPAKAAGPSRRRTVRLVAVLVSVAVLAAVVLSVPRTRHAVADLLGISGVAVHRSSPPGPVSPRTTLDQPLDLGRPVSLAQARALVGFPIALPASQGLGTPDAVYVRRGPGLQSVNLVYRPRSGFSPAPATSVGLLLSEFAGTATPYFDKYVGQGIPMRRVTVAGTLPGLYFPSATKILVRGRHGVVHDVWPRLAAPSLVWVRGEITYRLEANVNQARALAVAASLR